MRNCTYNIENFLSKRFSLQFFLFSAIIFLLALLFNYLPAKTMLFGVFKWHIAQKQFIEGGIELIVFYIIFCGLAVFIKRSLYFFVGIIIITSFYLRLHQVIEPVAMALLYIEIIISFGRWISKLIGLSQELSLREGVESLIIGLLFWSFSAIIASLFGYGGFSELRILTGIIGLLSITKGYHKPFFVYVFERMSAASTKERIACLFLLVILLAQFAKSTTAYDYDSIWYGLRPEHVLVGSHSFFDSLGLVQYVHYYPKLFELFLIPLSNLNSYSFIICGNVFILAFLYISIYLFAKDLSCSRRESLFLCCIIASLPVVSNMGSTAKPDILTALLLLLTVNYLWKWVQGSSIHDLFIGLISLIISFGTKHISFVYFPFIIFGIFVLFIFKKGSKEKLSSLRSCQRLSGYLLISLISLLTLFGVCLRTYLLTGLPTYPILGRLWGWVGFSSNYPLIIKDHSNFAKFRIHSLSEVIDVWYSLLFNAKTLPHVIMLWTGNVTVFLFIIILGLFLLKKISKTEIKEDILNVIAFSPVIIFGIILATLLSQVKGGDGNYYLLPVILSLMVFYAPITHLKNNLKTVINLCLFIFISLQSCLLFVSHPSWACGTSAFSFDLSKPVQSTNYFKKNGFKKIGALEIYNYVAERSPKARAIGNGKEQILNQLPCRFEHIESIVSPIHGNPGLFENREGIIKYIIWAKIDYIIMPKDKLQGPGIVLSVVDSISGDPSVQKIDSEKYYLLNITKFREKLAE